MAHLSYRIGNRAEICQTVAVSLGSVIKMSASLARKMRGRRVQASTSAVRRGTRAEHTEAARCYDAHVSSPMEADASNRADDRSHNEVTPSNAAHDCSNLQLVSSGSSPDHPNREVASSNRAPDRFNREVARFNGALNRSNSGPVYSDAADDALTAKHA